MKLPHEGEVVIKGETIERFLNLSENIVKILNRAGFTRTGNVVGYHISLMKRELEMEENEEAQGS